jgi:NAD+ diphosphatase
MPSSFISAISPPEALTSPSLWFLFKGSRLMVQRDENGARAPILTSPVELGVSILRRQYLGRLNNDLESIHCFCGEVAEDVEPPLGMVFESLRPLYFLLDEPSFWLAGRAVQIVEWDRTHQYCGRCGRPTIDQTHDRAKICPGCGLTSYPRLAPAVIVRIQRTAAHGPEILLARAQRFPTSMFSVLAGFVEPGETLEECVQREICEEVGITVKDIAYFGSQPWPFPNSLMIAFTAEYNDGEITVDPQELAEAGWFVSESLPNIPPPPSIANRLITTWLEDAARTK